MVHQLDLWSSDSLLARLLGLDVIVSIDCVVNGSSVSFPYVANPCSECWLNPWVLIAWYQTFSPIIDASRSGDDAELSRVASANSLPSAPQLQPQQTQSSNCEQLVNCLLHCSKLVLVNFYIVNNIVMMVWSIVFHGWLTFIFLLWANVLWVVPDTRRRMMLCTPLIVMYAQLLLIAQYCVSLNVRSHEVPAILWRIRSHEQLGFALADRWPVPPLLLQTIFAGFFWVTLHQHQVEKRAAAARALGAERSDRFVDGLSDWATKLGVMLRQGLLKLWIWIVMMFVLEMAIMGDTITAIRVVYMILFVGFAVTFQVSEGSIDRVVLD